MLVVADAGEDNLGTQRYRNHSRCVCVEVQACLSNV